MADAAEPAPSVESYVPLVYVAVDPHACPASSTRSYDRGIAYQYDRDSPVRLAEQHADKNLALRGYIVNTDAGLLSELAKYDSRATVQPPQFATLLSPARAPDLVGFYQVHYAI